MFCKKCGSQLVEDARFCANCGSQVDSAPYVAPTTQPIQPRTPNPMFSKFVTAITTFVKNPIDTVNNAAKSATHEWTLFAALAILVCALSAGISAAIGYGDFLKEFGYNILTSSAGFFGIAVAIWLLVTPILKKDVSIIRVFNMVGVAVLPVVAVSVPNILFSVIDYGLVSVFETAAMAMTLLLLYEGIKKLEISEKAAFFGLCISVAAVVFVVWIVGLIGSEIFYSYDPVDAYTDALDDLSDMFDF